MSVSLSSFQSPTSEKMREVLFLEGASFFYSFGGDSRTFVQLLIDDGFGRIICEVFDKLPFVSHPFEDVDSLPIWSLTFNVYILAPKSSTDHPGRNSNIYKYF